MARAPSRPLEPWRWLGVPALAAMGATIVVDVPIRVFGLSLPEPVFPLVLAFAWAVIRPAVLAPFVLIALGVFLDLFGGGPLGLWPISLLVAYAVALVGRALMAGQETEVMSVYFAASTMAAFAAAYVLINVAGHGRPYSVPVLPNLIAVVWQFISTLAFFPVVLALRDRFRDADIRFR